MLKEPTSGDRFDVEAGFDGSGVRVVDGRGRSVSTSILYEAVRALRELAPGPWSRCGRTFSLPWTAMSALGAGRSDTSWWAPAVRVLTRSFSEKLAGWQRPFSAVARRGLGKCGHPPPQQKLRQLNELGARIYVCGPSMAHFKVTADEFFLPGIAIAAYATFVEQMNRSGVHVFLQ
jgi:predicted peroxiredoxin